MQTQGRIASVCSLIMIAALLTVGAVSHEVLRHVIQTFPLWIPLVLGFRGSRLAKWAALPCFTFWLLIMTAIWLFLLGWSRIVSGSFSPTEIAMTVIVGIASLTGIVSAGLTKSIGLSFLAKLATLLAAALLQVGAFRISLLPYSAHR